MAFKVPKNYKINKTVGDTVFVERPKTMKFKSFEDMGKYLKGTKKVRGNKPKPGAMLVSLTCSVDGAVMTVRKDIKVFKIYDTHGSKVFYNNVTIPRKMARKYFSVQEGTNQLTATGRHAIINYMKPLMGFW